MDNRGNHLVAVDDSAINVPAVGAAHVVRRYVPQAPDELPLEVCKQSVMCVGILCTSLLETSCLSF